MPMSARASSASRVPIHDRLISEVQKRQENREKIKRNLEIEEMKECSFQPKTTQYKLVPRAPKPAGGYRSQTPIHERIGELQREKNDNLQRLRIQNEQA